jgi:hypothetical protein
MHSIQNRCKSGSVGRRPSLLLKAVKLSQKSDATSVDKNDNGEQLLSFFDLNASDPVNNSV